MKLTILALICVLAALAADSGMELYQKAVTQERAGKMDEAIKLYQQVAHDFASDRALAAKALVQAARGYEKLGQDGAVKLYERVAREYADQRESAQAAQAKLSALRQAETPTTTLRKIEFGENVKNVVATDGQQAVYWDETGKTLLLGDVAGRSRHVVLQTKPQQQMPRVTVSHDFSMALLYFPEAAEQSHWAVIKTDGTGYRELPNLPAGAILSSWSWDNRFVLIGRTLKKVSVADGQIQELLPGGEAFDAQFSPDGQLIAVGAFVGDVQVIPAQGGEPKVIKGADILGDWTRDGRFLIVAQAGSDGGVYAVPIENGQPAGEHVRIDVTPPDEMAAARTTATGVQIISTGAGLGERPRTSIASLDSGNHLGPWKPLDLIDGGTPAWSPDGRQIAYVAGQRSGGSADSIRIHTLADGADRELFRYRGLFMVNCAWANQRPNLYCGGVDPQTQKTAVFSVSLNSGAAERIRSFDGIRILQRFSPDDRILYMGRLPIRGGSRHAWEIGTDKEIEIPRGLVSPGGRFVYTVDSLSPGRREIRIRPASDLQGWRHLADLNYPAPPGAEVSASPVRMSWDDNWVIYQNRGADGKFGLYRISTSGGTPERLGDCPSNNADGFLVVGPDNRHFIVEDRVARRPPEFWVLENFLPKAKTGR